MIAGGPKGKAQAVAVKQGRIAAIGDNEAVLPLAGAETRFIDCGTRALLPGFIDAHVHLRGCAETYFGVDCGPAKATSVEHIVSLIRERAGETAPGEWVRAYGYHQFYLAGGLHPTRLDLDRAAPRNPVRLLHQNRHILVLNSLALRAAGITRDTPNPPGGLIERGVDTGEPTGLLVGMYKWVSRHVGPSLRPDELREGMRRASQSFLSQGVTCVHDASHNNGVDEWQLYRELVESGDVPLRVRMMVGLDGLDGVLESGLGPRAGDSRLRLGAAKIVVEQNGNSLHPAPKELVRRVRKAHDAGFQVAIHAITPRAIRAALKAIRSLDDGKARHRLEHCTYLPPGLIRELAEVGVLVVGQPSFLYYNGSRYLVEVPVEKFPWVCRGRSLLRQGVTLVGSTDSPVVPNSVLSAIGSAVTRESQVGFVFGPSEGVTAAEAVEMFTASGAFAGFEEGELGSIELGSYADFVVLEKDPLTARPEEIGDIRPAMTIVGGKPVWVGEALKQPSTRY